MKTYILTQKILALTATYEVRETKDGPVLFTVRGRFFTFTPFLEMQKGREKDAAKTHILKGNFWKTKFVISDMQGAPVADIQFPFFAFRKSFVLTVGGAHYKAQGTVFAWNFTAKNDAGQDAFTIQKEFAFRDKFTVNVDENLPVEPILLACISVDQRFFQQRRSSFSI
jgi:uncharacterized protein YxjI